MTKVGDGAYSSHPPLPESSTTALRLSPRPLSPTLSHLDVAAMASSIVRLQRMQCTRSLSSSFASASASSSRAMIYLPSHRHAMMSALSHDGAPTTTSLPNKPLGQTPPVVVPSQKAGEPSAKTLSPEPASPQTAARPPAAPKAERRKPTIKATKAAITLVRPYL